MIFFKLIPNEMLRITSTTSEISNSNCFQDYLETERRKVLINQDQECDNGYNVK